MQAVVVTEFGAEPRLAQLPVPEPGPTEVLVRIHAAALNPSDWKVADGALRNVAPHAFPLVMGSDGAGIVEKTGSRVSRLRAGDRVFGQFMQVQRGLGSYAEYSVADQDGAIASIPDGVPLPVAAALPTAGVAAYQAVEAARLKPGQVVLINGAGGGVGQCAIQFAARAEARVLATGTADLAEHLQSLGAATVFDFTRAPTHKQVAAAYPGGIDAVVDLVTPAGGDLQAMSALIRPGGTLVSANHAAPQETLAGRGVRGINLSSAASADLLAKLAELAATGDLRVHIDRQVRLSAAPATIAHARVSHARGKTLFLP
jgi:NADPH:quinone reductase-like Zn-dependent oxidoreductase